jgi:inhibitor of cysteine peptidase
VTVTVSTGASSNAGTLQLLAINPGNISGAVTDSNAAAIPGADVSGAGQTATTSATGTYSLVGVPAGAVTLTASAAGYSNATATATVTAGATVTAPALVLTSNTGGVSGSVTDGAGRGIAGATVRFGGGSTTTNATGAYALSAIPPGTIQLVASATGYATQVQNVTITAGATAVANYKLPPGVDQPPPCCTPRKP